MVLLVKGKENIPAGLAALALGPTVPVKEGNEVTVIGFPRLAGPWSVTKPAVASRSGREIILNGTVDEGNSGGPMIKDGWVVGLITSSAGAYGRATPTVSLQLFLEGYGIKPVIANEPATGGEAAAASFVGGGQTGEPDLDGFESNDYVISDTPYKQGSLYLYVATMTQPPTSRTGGQAKFFTLQGRSDVWTKYFGKHEKQMLVTCRW